MKIEKYKYLGNGKYKVLIDSNDYIIYEDIILKYNILGKDNISQKDLDLYLKDNEFFEAYYKAVSYINIKLRCSSEIEKYLSKDFSLKVVNDVTDKLKHDGYLNEDVYTEAFINDQINLKIVGPLKIRNDLINLKVSETVIDSHLESYTKDIQYEKIKKIIDKELRLNKNKSSLMIKNKILKNLIDKGFYKDDILNCMDSFNFDDSEVYKQEYEKLYRKLSAKYSGKQLEYKIKEKLYQKGFRIQ